MQAIRARPARLFAFCLASAASIIAAQAQDAGPMVKSPTDCTCRFQDRDYHLGDLVCMKSPQGLRMAQCGMVLNNTSWDFTGTACTISKRQPHDTTNFASAAPKPQK